MEKEERVLNSSIIFFYQKEPSYLSIKNALVFKRYDYLHSLSDRSTFDNDATCQYHEVPSFI